MSVQINAATEKQIALLDKLGVKGFVGSQLEASRKISALMESSGDEAATDKQLSAIDYAGGRKVGGLTKREASLRIGLLKALAAYDSAKSKAEVASAVAELVGVVRKDVARYRKPS